VIEGLPAQWRAGNTTLGAWLSLREPLLAEVAARAGYDYVCVDMQHGLQDLDQTTTLIHAMARTTAVPIVRVPWNEPGVIGRVLDAGSLGVIVPMVNTAEEAHRAVAACRYAPSGSRSFGPVIAGARYGSRYAVEANGAIACIPMIETREAVEAIDAILAVPGIDAIYVGPADLSMSYGLAPALDHADPLFVNALATIVDACRRHGVVPGIHASAAMAARRRVDGFQMITVGFELSAAIQALRGDITSARAALAD
jgi:4-hydroxy-2-oxoheptanedioate aldolase